MRYSLLVTCLLGWILAGTLTPTFAASHGGKPSANRIHVEIRDKVTTRKADTGDEFDARLTHDLYAGKQLIAPAGTYVRGEVIMVQDGQRGPQKQRAELEVVLTEIKIDGEWYPLEVKPLEFKAKRNHSVAKVGAGAAVGALVGGVRGAATGGVLGAGWAVMSRGKHVKLKRGTELTFKLRKVGKLKRSVRRA